MSEEKRRSYAGEREITHSWVTNMDYTSVRKCIHIDIDRRYNLIHEKVSYDDSFFLFLQTGDVVEGLL